MSAGCCRAARQDPSLARSYRGVVTAAESQHRPGVQRSATNLSRLPPPGVRLRIRAPMWQRCKLAASTSPAEKARFIGSHEPWLPTPLQRSRSRVVTRAAGEREGGSSALGGGISRLGGRSTLPLPPPLNRAPPSDWVQRTHTTGHRTVSRSETNVHRF
jgi:hypothetical protein